MTVQEKRKFHHRRLALGGKDRPANGQAGGEGSRSEMCPQTDGRKKKKGAPKAVVIPGKGERGGEDASKKKAKDNVPHKEGSMRGSSGGNLVSAPCDARVGKKIETDRNPLAQEKKGHHLGDLELKKKKKKKKSEEKRQARRTGQTHGQCRRAGQKS